MVSLSNLTVKVTVADPKTFTQLVKDLGKYNLKHYTYQLKTERAYKIVIRNLHHSTDLEAIKEELLKEGHEVTSIVNIRHWHTKAPLPLFFVDLKPKENNKSIYELNKLLSLIHI